jgi:hypothetical protein
MNTLKEQLKLKRPTLSDNSLTTYASILKNLHKTIFGSEEIDINRFNETDKILDAIKSIEPKKRKTILSALMIITNDKKKFKDIEKAEEPQEPVLPIPVPIEEPKPVEEQKPVPFDIKLLLTDTDGHNGYIEEKQDDSPRSVAEDVSFENYIKEVYSNLKNDAELAYKKKTLSTADYQLIQSFVIVSLLGGMHIKPRKSKDYVDFKIKNIDEANDNYTEKDKMFFNSITQQEREIVEVPKPLQSILKKWITINPTEYLLFDTNKNKLSSVKLNQRLNKIFNNKKVSINALIQSFVH